MLEQQFIQAKPLHSQSPVYEFTVICTAVFCMGQQCMHVKTLITHELGVNQ